VKWQYTQNPSGVMNGFNAWDNNQIVSHFAALPITMNLYGQIRKGLLCINVSTNPEYRGQKLFATLGEKTVQHARENGFDFLIAVPNKNSTHAFLKYFGFYLISPLTVKVGFGKNIYSDKEFKCYTTWDDNQLKWRLNNPANKYFHYSNGIISTPISFFAKTLSKIQPGNAGDTEIAFKDRTVCRPVNLYVGLGADTSKGFYFNMPPFVKLPPFNLVFKDLTDEIPAIKKDDILIQLIDLDII
jgi:N-acetylglutamate synthase-like GNAT family acetyltransferase